MAKYEFHTVAQTAKMLKRHPRTIRRWISEGFIREVSCVRDGYLIPDREISRILKGSNRTFRG